MSIFSNDGVARYGMINVKPLQIVSTRAWLMSFEVIVQHGVQKKGQTFRNVWPLKV